MFNVFNQAIFLMIFEVIHCMGYGTVYHFVADRICLTIAGIYKPLKK